jgi:hypothetical protein
VHLVHQDSFKVVLACNDKIDIVRVVVLGASTSTYLIDGGGCLHSCLDPQESISCLVDQKGLMLLSTNDGALAYCNVFGFLKTPFGLVIGFINNPQFVTTIIS